MHLDPTSAYHIRKLLRQNFDRLQSVVAHGAGLTIDPLSDLNAVIESLYLEDHEIQATISELQQLVVVHKRLCDQSSLNQQSLPELERRIFWLLGFKEKNPGRTELVLVVDDMADNIDILEGSLKHQGYRVETANNGAMAIDKARTLVPDVILLDVSMPGMDGFTVCQTLKKSELTSNIPILFLSANTSTQDKVKGFEVGGSDYITKPFQFEEVFARVEHQLKLASLKVRLATQNETLQKEIISHRETEALYRSMFEHAVDGMFQSSAHGTYLKVNASLAKMYGYPSPDAMVATIQDVTDQIYVNPERRREFITAINHDGTLVNFESQVYRQDGSVMWISESARMVYDSAGKFVYYEGTVRDITRYKQPENLQTRDRSIEGPAIPAQRVDVA